MTHLPTTEHPLFDSYQGVWQYTLSEGDKSEFDYEPIVWLVHIIGSSEPDDPTFIIERCDGVVAFMEGVPQRKLTRPTLEAVMDAQTEAYDLLNERLQALATAGDRVREMQNIRTMLHAVEKELEA